MNALERSNKKSAAYIHLREWPSESCLSRLACQVKEKRWLRVIQIQNLCKLWRIKPIIDCKLQRCAVTMSDDDNVRKNPMVARPDRTY